MKKTSALPVVFVSALFLMLSACGSNTTPTGGVATPATRIFAATPGSTAPNIAGFLPGWQYVGSTITISGTNFDSTATNNTVNFSGAATPAKVASATDTSLVVVVPASAAFGPISVTTGSVTATSATNFVVRTNGGNTAITGFSPASGKVGSSVTIQGTGFDATPGNNIVTFNGTRATVTSASATSLIVTVPDAISGNITVTTPGSGGTAVSHFTFAITSAITTPTVKSFTPLRGTAGTTVTISGLNFDAAGNNVVKFNGTEAAAPTSTSTTVLTAIVPVGATSGPITVTTAGVTAKSPSSFTLTLGATISGLRGGAIQGNNLTLTSKALTIAGGGMINTETNGACESARFNNPSGITSVGSNLYIADSGNRVIRKIDIATCQAMTVAGSGLLGSTDGTGIGATFSTPNGITTDGTSLFVTDSGNNRIRKITPLTGTLATMTSDNASVMTIAGSGSMGFDDGIGMYATFKAPWGITTDNTNLFVADGSGNRIRQIVIATSAVTTLAGSGAYSSTDGIGTAASFYRPHGITISPDHAMLYVTDSGSSVIRQIVIATQAVTTIAGTAGKVGIKDAIGAAAQFRNPNGIVTDATGTYLYIADTDNQKIRQVSLADYQVSSIAGSGETGWADNALGTSATFRLPNSMVMVGSNFYISDSGNNEIRLMAVAAPYTVSTFAGNANHATHSPVGVGTATKFNFPYGITTDGTNLYVADSGERMILKIVIATGAVTKLAGSGYFGSIDATGVSASFNYPMGLTTDGTNVYVVDAENQKIRQIVIATGVVTTLAGSGAFGSTDAPATFSQPFGITTDGTYLFIADSLSNKIRRVDISTGVVSLVAGSGVAGAADSTDPATATFNQPAGITTDGTKLYIADTGNNMIRQIVLSTGAVSTLAGSGNYWNDDVIGGINALQTSPTGTYANFRRPTGITTDGTNLYVTDADNNEIRKIVIATGRVSTLVGSGVFGSTDGAGTEVTMSQPVGITTDGTALYTTEYLNNLIRKIQ